MVTLKKINLTGQELGTIQVQDDFANYEANGQMIKDYITALRTNARQWSASTKGRSEVNHTTKKPHPQKGGGRARQGSLAAPQYKGGGRVFTPRPKFDQHIRINKQERKAALRSLLAEKIRKGNVTIIENFTIDTPKTKKIASLLKATNKKGRTLFIGEGSYTTINNENGESQKVNVQSNKHTNFIKSMQNLPRTEFSLASNINGYNLTLAANIILTEAALNELVQWLS